MAAKSKKASKQLQLPPGLSPAEEAEWFDAHPEYWEGPDLIEEWVEPQHVRHTAAVNLRLPQEMIAALKAEAERRGMSYQWLIQTWLEERLAAEVHSAKPVQ